MCVGIPLLLIALEGIVGTAMNGDQREVVDLSLTPEARPGDWVLGFYGTAMNVMPEDEALKVRLALQGLASIMGGGGAGDAFADLDARPPTLPPHLQAALAAGHTKG